MSGAALPVLPTIPDANFRLVCKNVLLTYARHLPKEELHDFVIDASGKPGACRVVHETGATGHEHTHVLLMCESKMDIKNCRKFDFSFDGEEHHPNIQKIATVLHLTRVRKYIEKEDGSPYGELPPAKLSSEEKFEQASQFVLECKTWPAVFRAPTTEIGMTISVKLPYFRALWETNAKKKTSTTEHTQFNRPKLDFSSTNWLVTGKSGTGKTSWALSHFENAVLVSHIDDLKKITDETDGLVFDDMSFNQWPAGSIIHLLDREQDRSIHCRYANAEIPAKLPKIFTSNRDDIFVPNTCTTEEQAGINRRFSTLHVQANLF